MQHRQFIENALKGRKRKSIDIHLMFMITLLVYFASISTSRSTVTASSSGTCYKYLTDIGPVAYSGELTVTQNLNCSDVCSTFQTVDIRYNTSFRLADFCFCGGNETRGFSIGGETVSACARSNCMSTQYACPYDGFSYATNIGEYPRVVVPHVFNVNVPSEINVITESKGVTSVSYNFGDGNAYTGNKLRVNHTYLTPGLFLLTVGVNKYGSTYMKKSVQKIIHVRMTKKPNMAFDLPPVFETNKSTVNYLTISRGADLSLKITQRYLKTDGTSLELFDTVHSHVSVYALGPAISSEYINGQLIGERSMLVIVPSLTFIESGSVTKFELDANKTGHLLIYILKPNPCLTCTDTVSLMGDRPLWNTTKVSNENFIIKAFVDVAITKTGFQVYQLQRNAEVAPGDVVSFIQSSLPTLNYVTVSNMSIKYKDIPSNLVVVGRSVGTFVTSASKVPCLRPHVTKSFKYKLQHRQRNVIGNVTFTATDNGTGEVFSQVTVPVQARIDHVELQVLPEISRSDRQAINVSANVAPYHGAHRPGVEYKFQISSNELSINETSKDSRVRFHRIYWSPGIYSVEVFAKNLLSNATNATTIRILDAIKKLEIIDPNNNDLFQKKFGLDVKVINGTNVTLFVDFGDNSHSSVFKKIIPNADLNKGVNTFNHTYFKCGMFTIKANASNDVTAVLTKQLSLKVSCAIKDLQVETTPSRSRHGNSITLSVKDELKLGIKIGAGSSAKYTINWGDKSLVDTGPLTEGVKVEKDHAFKKAGVFTVTVSASNNVNMKNASFVAKIQNCTEPPLVNFAYGTKEKPVKFTRGNRMDFQAYWTFNSEECQILVNDKIVDLQCSFNNSKYNSTLREEEREDGYACIIEKRVLDAGQYILLFTMIYNETTSGKIKAHNETSLAPYVLVPYRFEAYLEVSESDLIASISNGLFLSVAWKRRISRHTKATDFYLFQVDGSKSKDPDDPDNTVLKYQWFCRHEEGNSTHNFCNTKDWKEVGGENEQSGCIESSGKKLEINTTCFHVNATYRIMLNVSVQTRSFRSAVAEQKITIEDGDPPQVDLVCVTNCQKKVNAMERLVIRYRCATCFGRKLDAQWEIRNDETNKTVPNPDASESANLVIPANLMEEETAYTFVLTVKYAIGNAKTSTVQLKKMTTKRPLGGECSVGPKNGEAVKTKFKASCRQWLSEDGPIMYEFRYNPGKESKDSNDENYPLLNPTSLSTSVLSSIVLPAGRKELNYTIEFRIRIINQYGAYAEWTDAKVTVKNPDLGGDSGGEGNKNTSSVANKLHILSEAKPTSENDTQAMTAYVTSAVSVIASIPDVVAPTLEPTVPAGRFGDLVVDQAKLDEEKKKKEEKLKEVTKFKAGLVNDLKKLPATNILQVQAITNSLQSVTAKKDEVSPEAQDSAIDILVNMKDTLYKVSNEEKVGAVYLEKATTSYVQSISNLLVVEVNTHTQNELTHDHSVKDDEPYNDATGKGEGDHEKSEKDVEREKHKGKNDKNAANVNKLVGTLDAYFDVMSKHKVAGEKASTMETKSFNFRLKKVNSENQVNISIVENENDHNKSSSDVAYGFMLPNMTGVFAMNDLMDEAADLSLQHVNFMQNIYSSDEDSSEGVKSEIATLAIKTSGKLLNVSNMTEPIVINIKNNYDELKKLNVTLFVPGDIVFNKTKLTLPQLHDCNMLLNYDFVNDLDNATEFIVYLQYGEVPTSKDFDVKLNMSNRYGMIMTVSDTAKAFTIDRGSNDTNCNITKLDVNTTRVVNVRQIDNRTIVMWDFSAFHYSPCGNLTLYSAYSYNGPMPRRIEESNSYTFDVVEYRGSFNYSVRAFCTECTYWNEEAKKWYKDGCALDPIKTSLYTTSCKCNHLTAFGGFFVAPNPLPTPTLSMLKNGFVLLITVVTILLLYIVGLIVVRRVDKADLNKIGVCPLMDNKPEDKYLYEITVNTGSRRNAGTTSNVFFKASGDICDSDVHHLTDPERVPFQESNSDVFVMATPNKIGDINYIRLWHDNTGGDWYVRNIELIDLQTEEKYLFICTRWLAVDKHDGLLDCIVPVCGKDELSDFNYLFTNKSKRELSDAHIWFSIYARPPRSSFTRCQRLSVAISMLFCAMLASCMFYGRAPPADKVTENRIGGFTFSWHQVFVAIMSTCITVPVNLLLVGLFRVINPLPTSSKITPAGSMLSVNETEETINPSFSPGESRLINEPRQGNSLQAPTDSSDDAKRKRKKAFYLPHWCLYPTWILCISVILTSAFLVVWYGMTFGNRKSLNWLASVTICIVQDVILIQPLKVFAMALFIALIVKKLDEEEKSELEKNVKTLSKNESWLHKLQNEGTIFDRVEVTEPPDLSVLEDMRGVRLKEMKMAAISREMLLYLVFTGVVFMIGYNMRDEFAYHQTKDVKELLRLSIRNPTAPFEPDEIFAKLRSYQEFWDWTDALLLPQMYPKKWFNLSKRLENSSLYDFPGKIFLNDLSSKLVNGVRLRQMRVKPDSCRKAVPVRPFLRLDCAAAYGILDEEKRNFKYSWNKSYSSEPKTPINFQNKPWRYQNSAELDTYRIMANLNSYVGGGYVVELFPKFENEAILDDLKEKRWIDRHTRAVIVEFAVYNAQTNYFEMVMIVFEFPPGGGIVHYSSVATFRLSLYTKETAFFVITCFVLYLLFMVVFTIREARILYRVGWSYFTDFWNLVEMGNVLLSIIGLFFYFYLNVLRKRLLSKLPHRVPNVFINFHLASIWYDCLIHVVALICFFVTLKFIKILRFNKRISMLSSTLNKAWYPLAMFGIMFAIILAAVVFSATIIFGHMLYGYRNWWGTTSAVFSLLLGKFSYNQFESTNRILGPIFFFSFNIMINWIIMNMFISILNDVFACVQAEILQQENEYEMLDYIMGHVKSWLGFKNIDADDLKEIREETFDENVSDVNEESPGSSGSSMVLRSKLKRSGSHSSATSLRTSERATSEYWNRAEQLFVDDCPFLVEEEVSEEFIAETVEKFTKCINLLYFNDSDAPKNMSNFTEVK